MTITGSLISPDSKALWRNIWKCAGNYPLTEIIFIYLLGRRNKSKVFTLDKKYNVGTHDASWVFMMHHEYSWCIMSPHDASWVLMMQHEYSWCIMSTHDASWVYFWGGPWCSSIMRAIKNVFLEFIPGFCGSPGPPGSCPSTPPRDLPSTHARGQDDVSSKQTPSK